MRYPYFSAPLVLFVFLLLPPVSFGWPGDVIRVVDGDTLVVMHQGKQVEIRLYGIDCPEKDQDLGNSARDLLKALVSGRKIEVTEKDQDQDGRTVAMISVDGSSLNEAMVSNGYAWVYRQYCKDRVCGSWIAAENEAKKSRKGLWNGKVIVAPWDWRHRKKATQEHAVVEKESPVILIGGGTPIGGGERGQGQFRCDGRTHCSHMTSCEEAKFFLKNCPGVKMDGDGDGVPCEKQWCH